MPNSTFKPLFSDFFTIILRTSNFYREVTIMAMKIDPSVCVNCGTCEPDCPVGAISENDGHREIDASKCVSCGTCASECPASAISEA